MPSLEALACGRMKLVAMLLAATALTPSFALAQAPAGEGEAASSGDLSEGVLPAQRRGERLRDVPIAVTAVTADQIAAAGISGTADLNQLTPGLTVSSGGAYAQPTIRGIGTT